MKFGLTEQELQQITAVFKSHKEIETVLIFGSRALNTFQPASDIDLALKGEINRDLLAQVKGELEELATPYFFDVVDYGGINNPEFKAHIDKQGKIFYLRGWREVMLGDQIKIGRGSSPRPIQNFLSSNGIPWVKIADASASETRYIVKTKEHIKEEGRSTSVKAGDLIVSNSATPGIPKFMGIDACVHDGWLVFSEYKDLDKVYLYYFFLDYRRILEHSASGTVFVNLKTEIVRNIEINLPSILEQRAIAAVLSSFDDKIELLREQNKTLEGIAQAVFNHYFNYDSHDLMMDYDLKEQKNNHSKSVNHENHSANNLPKGWRVGKYSDIADVFTGKGIKKEYLQRNGLYRVLGANGEIGKTNEYLFDDDLILTGRVGTLGTVYISRGKIWISDNVLISKSKAYENFYFTYFCLKKLNFDNLNRGSTQPLITQTDLKNIDIIIPNREILEKWHLFCSNIFNKIFNNNSHLQTLSSLRDTLLPKMMKGEVRVGCVL